jgi:hypothetical protein
MAHAPNGTGAKWHTPRYHMLYYYLATLSLRKWMVKHIPSSSAFEKKQKVFVVAPDSSDNELSKTNLEDEKDKGSMV